MRAGAITIPTDSERLNIWPEIAQPVSAEVQT